MQVTDKNGQNGTKESVPHANVSRGIGGGMTMREKGAFYTNEC